MAQFYTITATDSAGQQASVNIGLEFSELTSELIIPVVSLVEGTTISTPLIPIRVIGGRSPYIFQISPALPSSLVFSRTRGEITGTPDTKFDETPFTITVTDSLGATTSKTLTVKTSSAIAINKLEPTAGADLGGTSVTITGIKFTGATSVKFGSTEATSFTVIDDTVITAISPQQASGPVNVSVTTPDGTTVETAASRFTYTLSPPRIDSISPTSGTEAGGTTVTISGRKLLGTNRVLIGGTSVNFTIVNDNTVTFVSPQRPIGTVDISITTVAGADVLSNAFTYTVAMPTVTAVSPSAGVDTGNITVTITGTRFIAVSSVLFGSTPATSFVVNSQTSISAVTPPGAIGPVNVSVVTASGTSNATTVFTYISSSPAYSISSNPSNGIVNEGQSITWSISTNNVANGTVLYWELSGGVSAADFTQAATSGQFTINNSQGTVSLTVSNDLTTEGTEQFTFQVRSGSPSGPIVAGLNATIQDTSLTPAPVITSVTPTKGLTTGGTSVVLAGNYFSGATLVKFGTADAASFSVVNNTTINAVTPARTAAGAVNVSVTTPSGPGTLNNGFTYDYRVDGIPAIVANGVSNTFTVSYYNGPANGTVIFEDLTAPNTFNTVLDATGYGVANVYLQTPIGDHQIKVTFSDGHVQNYVINVT
jgi:large repetitive protein